MTREEFARGYALLLAANLSGRAYTDDRTDVMQANLYFQNLKEFPAAAWEDVVRAWIRRETHWPLIPDLRRLLERASARNTPAPSSRPRLPDHVDPNGEPYRSIFSRWACAVGRKTFLDVTREVLEEWCAAHPEDLGARTRLEAVMQRLAAQKHKHEEVTP